MSDHAALGLILVGGFILQLIGLGLIVWMVRDVHHETRRQAEHTNGLQAATYLQGRQVKELVEEARRLIVEGQR